MPHSSDVPSLIDAVMVPGETCATIARADKAALMVDGQEYFGALRNAMLQARRTIVMVGWDLDSQMDMAPHLHDGSGIDGDGVPTRLKPLLEFLVGRNPELEVWLLLWDFTPLFVRDREPLPTVNLMLTTSARIHVHLDDALPFGACHHQKLVVIDDAIGFCGGLDVTRERWDTSDHIPDDPRRVSPKGGLYTPFHDTHMAVTGPAARALGDLTERRWRAVDPDGIPRLDAPDPVWPEGLEPHFTDIDIALSLTEPSLNNGPALRQIETLYCRAILQAEHLIFIENQFLTAPKIAEALTRRLQERPELEAVIVAPAVQNTWLETKSMGGGRRLFLAQLDEAGVLDRVTMVAPVTRAEDGKRASVMVHSKLMIIDDRFLTVGSANLNRRSMRFDTEANLHLIGDTDDRRATIAGLRYRLLGEHLGMEPAALAERTPDAASLSALLREQAERFRTTAGRDRCLLPIKEPAAFELDPATSVLVDIADPDRQLKSEVLSFLNVDSVPAFRPRLQKLVLVITVLCLIVLAAVWTMTPLADFANVDRLGPLFEQLTGRIWTPLLVAAVYSVASLTMFPITVLLVLTAITFEPVVAMLYAVFGTTLGAILTYGLGRWGGRRLVHRLMGHRLKALSGKVGRQGIVAVLALRMTPIAPFTLINILAGATHIRPRDFVIGTALGLLPSVVALTAVGESLWQLIAEPTVAKVGILLGVVLGWLALSILLQRLVNSFDPDGSDDD
ncbi:VTT domain-containing protein [Thalassobaculum sp.]|uniref:VTT domain-containing protein n=1 Tax=Thalassobaculum sp. TaxID=2022740 RepID=UPI003B5B0F68